MLGVASSTRGSSLLERASSLLGRQVTGAGRGGASDASHFAPAIPLTVDGLGPRGGGAHTPDEFVLGSSLRDRSIAATEIVMSGEMLDY